VIAGRAFVSGLTSPASLATKRDFCRIDGSRRSLVRRSTCTEIAERLALTALVAVSSDPQPTLALPQKMG
jgi:hypothetical protein